ncbi:signal transduction histidine kinase [Natranaerovirga pectinivora]|uniref:Heme sensor protein HssS n=1 Tax=Natranaerovirga pectinivora TaxID=682400 RepID=A0A4R3MJ70_9FIRM|nr:HAMP domain-containing sensor histidine kinase [Natranaerovirga pectinivora]TCT14314.1 signal transduction histidine kinase [Natranaerovirga pectinivora]
MKNSFINKSIYAKFAFIFLAIWWLLNSINFGIVIRVLSKSTAFDLSDVHSELFQEFYRMRNVTSMSFLLSACVGTICILFAVNNIVTPIRRLSNASKEVAKGNFDIQVKAESIDEIGQLTSDFNLMTNELKNIDVLRKDFVTNVSHEFKTPITSIKGFAKLIKDGQLTKEQLMEYSDIIINESERLSLLSSNLLKLSQLDTKLIREEATIFSLDEQIRKTILMLEVHWAKKNIDFDIQLEQVEYKGDEYLLQQVWINLIHNAIKFSEPFGKIKIKMYKQVSTVKIEVIDKGIGIAEEDQGRIFERFFKGDKSRTKEGNGLGLVIVKKIIGLSNGKIYFKSKLGEGSTFTVELPL